MNSELTAKIMITKHEAIGILGTIFAIAIDKWVVCAVASAFWLYRIYLLHKNRNKKD